MVTVATVTDDNRLLDVPKMTVAALRFTESARARIVKAGGKCLTLDQLVMTVPTGKYCSFLSLFYLNLIRVLIYFNLIGTGTLLLRATKDRTAKRYFGRACGLPGSHTRQRVLKAARHSRKYKGKQL